MASILRFVPTVTSCVQRLQHSVDLFAMTTLSRDAHRHSLSESCKLNYLATLGEDLEEDPTLPLPDEPMDDHHPLVLAVNGKEISLALEHRSKSESFICTVQGIVFEDANNQYQTKLTRLVALAANVNALGTQSNVLLAKKALRYRKAMGSRRIIE